MNVKMPPVILALSKVLKFPQFIMVEFINFYEKVQSLSATVPKEKSIYKVGKVTRR